ncbi:Fructosamine/Ketosamine-3-kinase [Thamnidium elegans]|uniref:protein-ribulosamine 3-kinase n=1 Tax=Thamnidium elegans TaxID=101142 RepID=A0A8H7VWB0_9FUNG|nr:hypothetical protein INT48_004343 [Thamnidium elegans]KAI8095163.1 Fructosamine/Ketosamine-3-kinase [Thamnidium elegans]
MTETYISSKLYQLKLCNLVYKVKSLSGGCISNAMCYSTDAGDFFVKTNTRKNASQWFLAESLALERIYNAVPGFAPKPIDHGRGDDQAYIITEYIQMQPKSSPEIQRALGKKLAQLHHSTEEDKFGFDVTSFCGTTELNNAWCCDWSQFFKGQRLEPLLKQVHDQNQDLDKLGKQICQGMDRWLGPDALPNVKSSLLHGDLWNGNWAVKTHGDDGPVIFDPASYYGHHEAEFGIMKMFGGFTNDCFEAYDDSTYNDQEKRQDRLILYELYHHLNHFAMFGGSYGNSCVELMEKLV